MRKKTRRFLASVLGLIAALCCSGFVPAATAPERINLQGVLRDASGAPMTGDVDMILRFFDTPEGMGPEILRDEHFGAGTGAVTVDGGLFNVALGSGDVVAGTASSLGEVFASTAEVWVEIEVEGETLSPRVRVESSAYALNAGSLDGQDASEFVDLTTDQVMTGDLVLDSPPDSKALGIEPTNLIFRNGSRAIFDQESCQTCGILVGDAFAIRLQNGSGMLVDGAGTGNSEIRLENAAQLRATGAGSGILVDNAAQLRASGVGSGIFVENGGELRVGGAASLVVQQNAEFLVEDALNVGGYISASELEVFSFANLQGGLHVSGDTELDGPLDVSGDAAVLGSLTVDTDTLTVDSSLGTVGVGQSPSSTYKLTIAAPTPQALHLRGPGSFDSGAQIEFGDIDVRRAFIAEDVDDSLRMGAANFLLYMIDSTNSSTTDAFFVLHDNDFTNSGKLAEIQEDGDLLIGGTLSQNQFDIAELFLMSEPVGPGDLVRVSPKRDDAIARTRGEADAAVLGVVSEHPGIVLGGGALTPQDIRSAWGDEVADRFEQMRSSLDQAILAENPELAALSEQLESVETYAARRKRVAAAPDASATDQAHTDLELAGQYQEERIQHDNRMESLAIEKFLREHFAPVALSGRVPVKVDTAFGDIETGDYLAPSPIPGVAMKATRTGPTIGTALESFSGGRGKVMAFVHRGHYTSTESLVTAQTELEAAVDDRTPDPVSGIQTLSGNLQVVLDSDGEQEARFSVFRNGEQSVGAEVFRVDEHGNVFTKGSFRPNSMDVAEYFALSEPAEAGHVLVADRESPGRCRLGRTVADPAVVGVVATEPGVLLGGGVDRIAASDIKLAADLQLARQLGDDLAEAQAWKGLEEAFRKTHAPVALTGTVDVKVDAGFGAIQVGDLLTTSPTPGHAMRAQDARPGTILGKALEPLDSGTGQIRVLVMLR